MTAQDAVLRELQRIIASVETRLAHLRHLEIISNRLCKDLKLLEQKHFGDKSHDTRPRKKLRNYELAEQDGARAFHAGTESIEMNPYPNGCGAHQAWREGYMQADIEESGDRD